MAVRTLEGIAGRPNAINPIFSQYNDVDRDLASLIFTGLTRADENGRLQPDLASQWTISPNGLIITFTLRTDAYWQDGVRLTADDVLFTIHTIQDPVYKGPPDLGAFWRTVAVTQVDAATVRFQLTQTYAPFMDYTTIGILPAHLLKDVPPAEMFQNQFNRHPVGTGPFQLTELTANYAFLDVNPHYYGRRPYLSRIEFKFYPDYESVFAAYNREEVEGISRILPADLVQSVKSQKPQVVQFTACRLLAGFAQLVQSTLSGQASPAGAFVRDRSAASDRRHTARAGPASRQSD